MDNNVIEVTDETRKKLRDFDEQEAYFLLCEIFSYAQATKDYAKFQTDLSEWKKRYPIDLFSEDYRRKIKYMLSKEFLDTILKNFVAFDELSKKDPSQGLEKLRKILDKAEKHKNEKQLNKDLDELYTEYPLKFLKEKYPHIISQLLSQSNKTRILQKFDSDLAFKELNDITQNPQNFEDVDDFKGAIEEWKKLYPTDDFNDKFRGQVEKILTDSLDTRILEELFPHELDLTEGQTIPLEYTDISIVNKDALHDFFKIVDTNKGDINSLFDWICKYGKYINEFNSDTKNMIVNNLMSRYYHELPPSGTKFQIPKMDSGINDLLSLSEYESIDDTKKQVVLQLLGILSNGMKLSNEDIYRLGIINSNSQKVDVIENSQIEKELYSFIQENSENELTSTDDVYLSLATDTRVDVPIDEDKSLTSHKEYNDIVVEEPEVNTDEPVSFKESIKIQDALEKVNINTGTSGSTDSGTTSGGSSSSISVVNVESTADNTGMSKEDNKKEDKEIISTPEILTANVIERAPNEAPSIKAVILESKPEISEIEVTEPEIENIPDVASNTADNLQDTTDNSTIYENISNDSTALEKNVAESVPSEVEENTSRETPIQNFFKRIFNHSSTTSIEHEDRDDR